MKWKFAQIFTKSKTFKNGNLEETSCFQGGNQHFTTFPENGNSIKWKFDPKLFTKPPKMEFHFIGIVLYIGTNHSYD